MLSSYQQSGCVEKKKNIGWGCQCSIPTITVYCSQVGILSHQFKWLGPRSAYRQVLHLLSNVHIHILSQSIIHQVGQSGFEQDHSSAKGDWFNPSPGPQACYGDGVCAWGFWRNSSGRQQDPAALREDQRSQQQTNRIPLASSKIPTLQNNKQNDHLSIKNLHKRHQI